MAVRIGLGLICGVALLSCASDAPRVAVQGVANGYYTGAADERAHALTAEQAAGTPPAALTDAVAREHERFAGATVYDLRARAPRFEAPAPGPLGGIQYLDRILDPKTHGQPAPRRALNEAERSVLGKQRFVVTERLGDVSYAGLYHRIYEHDQPVFITADSVLHAFHKSYDNMLAELETHVMIGALEEVLSGMAAHVEAASEAHEGDVLHEAVRDADVFVAVGRTLLLSKPTAPSQPENAERVRAIVAAIDAQQPHRLTLFGRARDEDFTQLRPRGHYTKTEALERYFRAMMWLGRTELEVAGRGVQPGELAGAVALHELLSRSGQLARWRAIDELIQTFVGEADSLTMPQLDALLSSRRTGSPLAHGELKALQDRIARSGLGAQAINSQPRAAWVDATAPTPLPSSFSFFPQRFTVDSWVLSQLVFDRARHEGVAIDRQIPSGVDVAFAALGNDGAAPVLAERIVNPAGMPGRDGYAVQASLLATRAVIDARPPSTWEGTVYEGWLGALRALSEPTVDERYPSVMRGAPWANRRMQTQLASWAELRHDTILYVKQSYGMVLCEYPAGFVELQPAFWRALEQAARLAARALHAADYPKELSELGPRQIAHWQRFADTVSKLRAIADKELASLPMSKDELQFLRAAVEEGESRGCGGPVEWDGWFVDLYYTPTREGEALEWDALVADVHTSPRDGVLTVATGGVDLMVAIIERGGHTMAFAGPTAQYWELVAKDGARMTDLDWKGRLSSGGAPPRPEWTSPWLVAGEPAYASGRGR